MSKTYEVTPTIFRSTQNDELREKVLKLEITVSEKNNEIESLQKKLDK